MRWGPEFLQDFMYAPEKTQISLCIRAVWSESLHGILWVTKDPKRIQAYNEDWSACAILLLYF